ncbi:hypothetical protein AUC45_07065 [Erythrobacter sp. YT30]|nr:hypothetical protein AUC45_07065 [Erythrobacter sp. YT30]
MLARAAGGDVLAFSSLVERYTPTLYKLAFRLLLDRQEAEDAVQDVFTKLWKCANTSARPQTNLRGWLRQVCTRICLDRLRKKRPVLVEELPEMIDETPAADAILEEEEMRNAIARCFEALSTPQRIAVVLTYFEELSNKDAAERMGLHIKAFESTLRRARCSLASMLEPDYTPANTFERSVG